MHPYVLPSSSYFCQYSQSLWTFWMSLKEPIMYCPPPAHLPPPFSSSPTPKPKKFQFCQHIYLKLKINWWVQWGFCCEHVGVYTSRWRAFLHWDYRCVQTHEVLLSMLLRKVWVYSVWLYQFFFFFCVPSYISGVHHFGWDFCICDCF